MKKTSKLTKKPAPAKKSKPAARKAPPAPVVKKTVPKAIVTTISAQLDIGFGNALYLRGEGPGLSWDRGVAMDCVADDRWTLVLAESALPVVFKFLVNDEIWSAGVDYTAQPGTSVVFTPVF